MIMKVRHLVMMMNEVGVLEAVWAYTSINFLADQSAGLVSAFDTSQQNLV